MFEHYREEDSIRRAYEVDFLNQDEYSEEAEVEGDGSSLLSHSNSRENILAPGTAEANGDGSSNNSGDYVRVGSGVDLDQEEEGNEEEGGEEEDEDDEQGKLSRCRQDSVLSIDR
mmetsp:Transcript_688/g.1476  ORF Transcript_688/g.1476 Transcript_688/m.1476 type:complete len:115 (+) Transcript_688:719-1063(+)